MTESLPAAQPSSRVKEQNRPSESQRDKEQPPGRKPSKSPLTKHENNPQLEYRVGNDPNRKSGGRDFKRAAGFTSRHGYGKGVHIRKSHHRARYEKSAVSPQSGESVNDVQHD